MLTIRIIMVCVTLFQLLYFHVTGHGKSFYKLQWCSQDLKVARTQQFVQAMPLQCGLQSLQAMSDKYISSRTINFVLRVQ